MGLVSVHTFAQGVNPFQPSVAFHIETSHLNCITNQKAGFYMNCITGLELVKALCKSQKVAGSYPNGRLVLENQPSYKAPVDLRVSKVVPLAVPQNWPRGSQVKFKEQ